jgi:hypothetical protein
MLKKLFVPVVTGGAVVGVLALGTTAYAATPAPTPTTATTPAHTGKGAARAWLRTHRKELRAAGVTNSATTIGITPQALAADLKAGASVATVAGQHNVSVPTVVAALDSAATAKVNQAVGDHQLTQARATKIEARLPGLLTTWVNHTF